MLTTNNRPLVRKTKIFIIEIYQKQADLIDRFKAELLPPFRLKNSNKVECKLVSLPRQRPGLPGIFGQFLPGRGSTAKPGRGPGLSLLPGRSLQHAPARSLQGRAVRNLMGGKPKICRRAKIKNGHSRQNYMGPPWREPAPEFFRFSLFSPLIFLYFHFSSIEWGGGGKCPICPNDSTPLEAWRFQTFRSYKELHKMVYPCEF